MLVSKNGAQMKQGDNVLIWGASGGLGALAIQFVLNGGGFPIGVVSNEWKADVVRKLGCKAVIVIKRQPEQERFIDKNGKTKTRQILRLKAQIRRLTNGEDCDIVFEHTGRATFAASVAVTKTGGKIVTCGSTSGYDHVFDNRYFWQSVKSIIGSHGANYNEAMKTARLISKGSLLPVLSEVFPFSETKEAVHQVHKGLHVGKLGILCLSPQEGLGVRNRDMRDAIGEKRINVFRNFRSQNCIGRNNLNVCTG
jgi:crotonyl-CoA reductase